MCLNSIVKRCYWGVPVDRNAVLTVQTVVIDGVELEKVARGTSQRQSVWPNEVLSSAEQEETCYADDIDQS